MSVSNDRVAAAGALRREQGVRHLSGKAMPSTNFDKRIILRLDIDMMNIKGRLDGHRTSQDLPHRGYGGKFH